MFRVFVRKRKRRLSSPRIVALSVGVHLLLFGGVVAVSTAKPAPVAPEVVMDVWELTDTKTPPPAPAAPAPPSQPADPQPADVPPAPRMGETVELHAPATVPDRLPEVNADAPPLRAKQVSGLGTVGSEFGRPAPAPAPATGDGSGGEGGNPGFGEYVYGPDMVEATPVLINGREVARLFDRNYPPTLSEAGIAGRVTLEMIVDKDGRVRPGSVRVVSTTHEEFSAATLRIVERFRFTPARMGEEPVAVTVTLPVDWRPEQR